MAVKIKKGFITDANNKNITTFEEMLTEEANCGCSIDCCFGIITLPNWVSATGVREDYALAIIDGALVVDAKETIIDQIKVIKAV